MRKPPNFITTELRKNIDAFLKFSLAQPAVSIDHTDSHDTLNTRPMKSLSHDTRHLSRHDSDDKTRNLS